MEALNEKFFICVKTEYKRRMESFIWEDVINKVPQTVQQYYVLDGRSATRTTTSISLRQCPQPS